MKKLPKALHYSLLLMILGIIVGSLLSLVNGFTSPIIEENKMKIIIPVLEEIVPEGKEFKMVTDKFKDRDKTIKNIFIAYSDANQAEKIAVIYWVETKGYGNGAVETLVAIDLKNDKFIDLQVVSTQGQTPGIGDIIETYDFKLAGKSLDSNVDNISGATYSANAVIDAVRISSTHYKDTSAAIKGLEG